MLHSNSSQDSSEPETQQPSASRWTAAIRARLVGHNLVLARAQRVGPDEKEGVQEVQGSPVFQCAARGFCCKTPRERVRWRNLGF